MVSEKCVGSQSAFMRGFIDDAELDEQLRTLGASQSAFMRGFIDDGWAAPTASPRRRSLNPRSCAASSMTTDLQRLNRANRQSQSAFMRGFIDDPIGRRNSPRQREIVSIRVHARLHR